MPAQSSIPDFDGLMKLSTSGLLAVEKQDQKQQKDHPGCSSPLSPSLSFFSPSPYILNCKRRSCGAWETRDALSGMLGSRAGSSSKKDGLNPVPAETSENHHSEKHPGSFPSTGRLCGLSDQLVDLKEALELFISECSCSRSLHDEEAKGGRVDLQALRRRNVRAKILAEILSARKASNPMEPVNVALDENESRKSQEDMEDFQSISENPEDEFFDAREASSSDGYSSEESLTRRHDKRHARLLIDSELLRQLQMEVKRRMKAEEILQGMQVCQENIVKILLSPGCSTPPRPSSPQPVPPAIADHGLASLIDEEWQDDDALILTVISSALLRGALRADEAEALKKMFETKDREISRLRRKLKFFEQVNQELSQKNQEATERARRFRKTKQKWLAISGKCLIIGAVIGVSGSLLYYYFPWERLKCSREQPRSSDLA